ncbi:hypothetical protein LCGC14_0548580 [marine sediment metagenome]|uniref:Uncharacterized protein n=1 Tax=marine sediment metagenome TaxID=412755 RepID=A0A0F9UYU5_9ZZZZ
MNPMIKERIETHNKHLIQAMDEMNKAFTYYKQTKKFDFSHLIGLARLLTENVIILDEYQRLEYSCIERDEANES